MNQMKFIDKKIHNLERQIINLKSHRAKLSGDNLSHFKFKCSYEVTLNEAQIWPDGDAPDNPTVKDVRNLLSDMGPNYHIIDDWNLIPKENDLCNVKVSKVKLS